MAAGFSAARAPLCLSLVVAAHAAFSVSSTVGSSMVLQRDMPTTSLWGLAPAGAVVQATLSSSATPFNATTDASGVWRVALPAFPASGSPVSIAFSTPGETTITISDVLFGDVLLCSGQSNMQLSVQMALNATAELAAIDAFGPMIRVLKVRGVSFLPGRTFVGLSPAHISTPPDYNRSAAAAARPCRSRTSAPRHRGRVRRLLEWASRASPASGKGGHVRCRLPMPHTETSLHCLQCDVLVYGARPLLCARRGCACGTRPIDGEPGEGGGSASLITA